jgi:hypothetical protein
MNELMNEFWQEAGVQMGSLLWGVAEQAEMLGKHAAAAMLREIGLREPKPFLTGSRAYGSPRPDSDTDICALVDQYEMNYLQMRLPVRGSYNHGVTVVMPGYDILLFPNKTDFNCWRDVNDWLIERRPVTKELAVDAFETMLQVRRGYKPPQQQTIGGIPISWATATVAATKAVLYHTYTDAAPSHTYIGGEWVKMANEYLAGKTP